jgi:integrase
VSLGTPRSPPAGAQAAPRRSSSPGAQLCARTGRTPLPGSAESLASYVAELAAAGKSGSTIGQAISAIRSMHEFAGYTDTPSKGEASKALRGHKRHEADRNRRVRKAEPLTIERLHQVVADLDPARPIDARDRALLVLGFAGCLRRSNVVALDREDLAVQRDRLSVTIRRSKTDQEARGRVVDLPLGSDPAVCPVRTLEAWLAHLDAAGYTDGPIFRPVDQTGHIAKTRLSDHSASRVIARRAAAVGLTELTLGADRKARYSRQFTGHSLRAGGATSMAKAGATTSEIAEHGGWSVKSAVVHEYVRRDEAWRRNPMRSVL